MVAQAVLDDAHIQDMGSPIIQNVDVVVDCAPINARKKECKPGWIFKPKKVRKGSVADGVGVSNKFATNDDRTTTNKPATNNDRTTTNKPETNDDRTTTSPKVDRTTANPKKVSNTKDGTAVFARGCTSVHNTGGGGAAVTAVTPTPPPMTSTSAPTTPRYRRPSPTPSFGRKDVEHNIAQHDRDRVAQYDHDRSKHYRSLPNSWDNHNPRWHTLQQRRHYRAPQAQELPELVAVSGQIVNAQAWCSSKNPTPMGHIVSSIIITNQFGRRGDMCPDASQSWERTLSNQHIVAECTLISAKCC